MAFTQYDCLPESQKLKVDLGEVAPRPPHWVMYTVRPPPCTAPYTFRHGHTDGYVAPTVVVDSGGGAFANACFHAPLTTTTT